MKKVSFLAIVWLAVLSNSHAAITVNFFADAGTKRPHRADGEPLENGQIVQVGTFTGGFDPLTSNVTLVDLLANWKLFGQTVTETNEIAPAGSFYGGVTGDATGFSGEEAFLLFIRKSSGKSLSILADDVLEFGLFRKLDFSTGDSWIFPSDNALFPLTIDANEANFTTANLGKLEGDKLILRTYDPAPAQRQIFGDFARYEGDWIFSTRFGFLWESATYPWIYHLDLEWLYHVGLNGENLWGWSPDRGWLWISLHPYIYSPDLGDYFDVRNP